MYYMDSVIILLNEICNKKIIWYMKKILTIEKSKLIVTEQVMDMKKKMKWLRYYHIYY